MEQKLDVGEDMALALDVGVGLDVAVGQVEVLALEQVGSLHHQMQGNENHRQ